MHRQQERLEAGPGFLASLGFQLRPQKYTIWPLVVRFTKAYLFTIVAEWVKLLPVMVAFLMGLVQVLTAPFLI